MRWFGWFILVRYVLEGMAETSTTEIIATLRSTVPQLEPAQCATLLVTLMGLVGKHKQFTAPNVKSKTAVSNGISLYCDVGDKMTVKGNLIVRYKGAAGTTALRAIMEGKALSGLKEKEAEISASESIGYDELKSQIKELGV